MNFNMLFSILFFKIIITLQITFVLLWNNILVVLLWIITNNDQIVLLWKCITNTSNTQKANRFVCNERFCNFLEENNVRLKIEFKFLIEIQKSILKYNNPKNLKFRSELSILKILFIIVYFWICSALEQWSGCPALEHGSCRSTLELDDPLWNHAEHITKLKKHANCLHNFRIQDQQLNIMSRKFESEQTILFFQGLIRNQMVIGL